MFVVKVYDHTASRQIPSKELLACLVKEAAKLDEALALFYKSWRVTEIGPDAAILTYRWQERNDITIPNVVMMLRLYKAVFATPRKLSSSETVEAYHCHGDALCRNFEPPALLDLDFAGPVDGGYPAKINTTTLDRHPAFKTSASLPPMALAHDLWGFGKALIEWFPMGEEARDIGQSLWIGAESAQSNDVAILLLEKTIDRLEKMSLACLRQHPSTMWCSPDAPTLTHTIGPRAFASIPDLRYSRRRMSHELMASFRACLVRGILWNRQCVIWCVRFQ
jgi:hypothetical protein